MKKIIHLFKILTILFSIIIIIGEKDVITINFILAKLTAILYLVILAKKSNIWR